MGIRISSAADRALMVSIPKEGQQSRRITSYWSRTVFRSSWSIVSRLMMFTSVTSIAARSMLAGSRSKATPHKASAKRSGV